MGEKTFRDGLKVNLNKQKGVNNLENNENVMKNNEGKQRLEKAKDEMVKLLEEKIKEAIVKEDGKINENNCSELDFLWDCQKFILYYDKNVEVLKNNLDKIIGR